MKEKILFIYRHKKSVNEFIKTIYEKKYIVLSAISTENSKTLKFHTFQTNISSF